MTSVFPAGRGSKPRVSALVAAVVVAGLAACSGADTATAPETPSAPAVDGPALRRAAFILDVNRNTGAVRITTPERSLTKVHSVAQSGDLYASLLGADAISLQATNFFASTVGQLQPNRVEVFFDLAVTNLLSGITFTTSTFPLPPANQVGLILFPFSTTVTTTQGGVGGTGGSDVIVELPSRGQVVASRDWNGNATLDRPTFPVAPGAGGEPHNFFNDATCPAESSVEVASDCFRYETYGNLGGGVTSATRRVGFSLDAGVSQFRARIIAAADLLVGAPGTGTINVSVSSPQRGPLAGIPVALTAIGSGTGASAPAPLSTSAAGTVSFTGVAFGTRAVWLGAVDQINLFGPGGVFFGTGCTRLIPGNGQFVNLISTAATATITYNVECAPLTGTLNGTVTRTGAGTQSLDGATFTVTPTAAGLTPVVGQLAGLGFSVAAPIGFGTGAGAGSVALSNLPAGCTAGAPAAYSGLTTTTPAAVALTVNCDPPASTGRYRFVSQFGAIAGGTVDLTLAFDPSGFDAPTVPGPDAFAGGQGVVTLSGATGRITGRSAVATANFGAATLGGTLPITAWSAVSTQPGGFTGNQIIAVIRYTIGAGAAGVVTTANAIQEINTPTGDNLPLIFSGAGQNIDVVEATLSIP